MLEKTKVFAAYKMARTQHVVLPLRLRMVDRVLMQVGIPSPVERFSGSFYGVSAKVELNMRTRIAVVHLKGAPVGGRVSGTGWLKNPEEEAGTGLILSNRRLRSGFAAGL